MFSEPPSITYSQHLLYALCLRIGEIAQPFACASRVVQNQWLSITAIQPGEQVERHLHPFYEGFILLQGSIELVTPWQTQVLPRGSVMVFVPGTAHQWRAQQEACLFLVLSFILDRPLTIPTRRPWPVRPDALWEAELLLADAASGEAGWAERAQARLSIMYSHLLRLGQAEEPAQPLPPTVSQLVASVDQLLLADLTHAPCLEILAGQLSMSARHLTRQFRCLTGMSVHERLESFRMERAAHLLRSTDIPIATVARAVGIGNAAYFARRFHQRFELLPKAYRVHFAADGERGMS